MSGLNIPGFDQNLWEWDRTLWFLLQQCATKSPEAMEEGFGVPELFASVIANLSPRQVERLSSGVVSSFHACFAEDDLLSLLAEPYDHLDLLRHGSETFLESHFWQILGQASTHCPELAALRYGVPRRVSAAAAKASTIQLRHVSFKLDSSFRLRYPATIIHELVEARPRAALMKRMAYCMSNSRLDKAG